MADPDDPGAVASAISSLAKDPVRLAAMGKRAREWVERKHGENVLAEYVNSVLSL